MLLPLSAILAAARIGVNFLFRLHQWSFRLSGLADATRVVFAGLTGTAAMLGIVFFARTGLFGDFDLLPPRSVVALEFFITTTMMGLVRYSSRLANVLVGERQRAKQKGAIRTIIVGAGAAGEMLLRDLQRSQDHNYHVVGFVDDDPSKWGMIVGGKTVLGPIDGSAAAGRAAPRREGPDRHPAAAGGARARDPQLCGHSKLRFKMLAVSFLYHQARGAAAMLQELTPGGPAAAAAGDFSPRRGRRGDPAAGALVTGAAGSIGSELCRQLLQAGVPRS